jgi:DNA-binding CsgD family transcriptional regulator
MDADSPTDARLTDTQLAILVALCRPISAGIHFATPATNQEIADEVYLSVDAVKGHLRGLYREFGIDDLPHNQKRARLVELAIASGYVKREEPTGPMTEAERMARAPVLPEQRPRRSLRPILTATVLIAIVIGATLAISGIFNSGTSTPTAPTPAAFRAQVAGYCKLAIAGAAPAGGNRAETARGYLAVIETMRGRLESLVPPTTIDVDLERFGAGLTNAADYTSDVAERPPTPGSAAEAKDVAELTHAAGQVRAGAVGYGLGPECLAIGDLVSRSAANAAAP